MHQHNTGKQQEEEAEEGHSTPQPSAASLRPSVMPPPEITIEGVNVVFDRATQNHIGRWFNDKEKPNQGVDAMAYWLQDYLRLKGIDDRRREQQRVKRSQKQAERAARKPRTEAELETLRRAKERMRRLRQAKKDGTWKHKEKMTHGEKRAKATARMQRWREKNTQGEEEGESEEEGEEEEEEEGEGEEPPRTFTREQLLAPSDDESDYEL